MNFRLFVCVAFLAVVSAQVSITASLYQNNDCAGVPDATNVLFQMDMDGCSNGFYMVKTNQDLAVMLTFSGACPLVDPSKVTGFREYPIGKCVLSGNGISFVKYSASNTEFTPVGMAHEIALLSGTGVVKSSTFSNGNEKCESHYEMISGTIFSGSSSQCETSFYYNVGCQIQYSSTGTPLGRINECTTLPIFSTGEIKTLSISFSIERYYTPDCSDKGVPRLIFFSAGDDGCLVNSFNYYIVNATSTSLTFLKYNGGICPVYTPLAITGFQTFSLNTCTKLGGVGDTVYSIWRASKLNFSPTGLDASIAALSGKGVVKVSEFFGDDTICSGKSHIQIGEVQFGSEAYSYCLNNLGYEAACNFNNTNGENSVASIKKSCTTFPNFYTPSFVSDRTATTRTPNTVGTTTTAKVDVTTPSGNAYRTTTTTSSTETEPETSTIAATADPSSNNEDENNLKTSSTTIIIIIIISSVAGVLLMSLLFWKFCFSSNKCSTKPKMYDKYGTEIPMPTTCV